MERWKPVVGYEGYYSVSTLGRVRSEARTISRKDGGRGHTVNYRKRIISTPPAGGGHYSLGLNRGGKRKTVEVHRLVFEAFVRPLLPGEHVHHLNDVKTDNRVENLQALPDVEHKRLTQKRLKEKCALADFLTLCWIIQLKEKVMPRATPPL